MSDRAGGPTQGLVIHAFVYVAVCGLLIALWALTAGTFDEVSEVARDPGRARQLDFWPIWVILGWGTGLMIHVGVVLSHIPRWIAEERARRRRRAATQNAARDAARQAVRLGEEVMSRSARAVRAAARVRPTAREPARRWVAVMFTDIVGSTQMAETVGDDEWARLLARYRDLVRAAFAGRGGEEVGTQGDGFLVRFPNPAEAVRCAVDIQREVGEVDDVPGFEIQVRIGVHAGEAVEDDDDLIGRVVNLAARVTSAAEPGEILVTEPVADHVGDALALEGRGLKELRGVSRPRHLLAVRWDGPSPGR